MASRSRSLSPLSPICEDLFASYADQRAAKSQSTQTSVRASPRRHHRGHRLDHPAKSPVDRSREARRRANPLTSSDSILQSVRPLYHEKCSSCHGESGKGDGHDASLYDPAPTNFTDTKRMTGVTDGELFYKLSQGRKPMPSFKKRLTEDQRWRLVLLLRSFAGAPAGSSAATSDNLAGTSNAQQ